MSITELTRIAREQSKTRTHSQLITFLIDKAFNVFFHHK